MAQPLFCIKGWLTEKNILLCYSKLSASTWTPCRSKTSTASRPSVSGSIKSNVRNRSPTSSEGSHLRRNELQSAALPVLLLQQQIPHLGVVLRQALVARPRTIFIHHPGGGGLGLLATHSETDRGSLAQRLWAWKMEGLAWLESGRRINLKQDNRRLSWPQFGEMFLFLSSRFAHLKQKPLCCKLPLLWWKCGNGNVAATKWETFKMWLCGKE